MNGHLNRIYSFTGAEGIGFCLLGLVAIFFMIWLWKILGLKWPGENK